MPVVPALAWGLVAVTALLDWWAVARQDRRTETVVKPVVLLALTAAALAGGVLDSTAGRWLVVALLLGAVGDTFLLGDSRERFLAGLTAFLLGHLAYVAAFWSLGAGWSWWVAVAAVVLLGSLVSARTVLPRVLRDEGAATALPVAVYMAVIGAMLLTAGATGEPLVVVGAAVFVVSDTVLALDRFDRPRRWVAPYPHVAVMTTYHVGQVLVVLGVLVALARADG
ncbi:lysoplasmalogenase [Nocardioides sp. CPCC 205120]|uniref:lysoplasmalogenase n=1 Tax=Nocardioides sp. CPCC 205120 TaxID=3406462 RepID=UPI003B514C37